MRKLINLVIILTIAFVVSIDTYAMRCGANLILEGDTTQKMISFCGTPSSNTINDISYTNKDGDGGNYYIHVDNNGIINDIEFSRN